MEAHRIARTCTTVRLIVDPRSIGGDIAPGKESDAVASTTAPPYIPNARPVLRDSGLIPDKAHSSSHGKPSDIGFPSWKSSQSAPSFPMEETL